MRLIADRIKMPVGADFADVSGNGHPDVIVCYDLYGPIGTIHDANTEGGKIDWLENPGTPDKDESRWKRHYVGRATGMHRLRATTSPAPTGSRSSACRSSPRRTSTPYCPSCCSRSPTTCTRPRSGR